MRKVEGLALVAFSERVFLGESQGSDLRRLAVSVLSKTKRTNLALLYGLMNTVEEYVSLLTD